MPMSLASLASSPIEAFANYTMQKDLMDKSNEQYKENQLDAYLLQRRLMRDSTPLAVQGMREAGLNPASMTDPMQPASVPSAPHPTTPAAPSVNLAADTLAFAQAENLQAQTKKLEIENTRLEDEDATTDLNLRRHFQTLVDDPKVSADDKKFYQSILEHAPNYSVGARKALDDYFSLSEHSTNVLFNRFDKAYQKAVIDANLRERVPDWLAKLPEQQFNEAVNKIGNIAANTLLLSSETALNSDKANKLKAEIQKDYAEMKHLYHQDFASMWENGDYQSLFVTIAGNVLPSVIQGVAFGKAFKGGTKTPAVSGSAVSPVGRLPNGKSTPLSNLYETKAFGKPKMDAVSKGIFKTFKNDKDRTAFLSLLARRGATVANQSFHQWLASPYRRKYSYSDWLGIGERYHK